MKLLPSHSIASEKQIASATPIAHTSTPPEAKGVKKTSRPMPAATRQSQMSRVRIGADDATWYLEMPARRAIP